MEGKKDISSFSGSAMDSISSITCNRILPFPKQNSFHALTAMNGWKFLLPTNVPVDAAPASRSIRENMKGSKNKDSDCPYLILKKDYPLFTDEKKYCQEQSSVNNAKNFVRIWDRTSRKAGSAKAIKRR